MHFLHTDIQIMCIMIRRFVRAIMGLRGLLDSYRKGRGGMEDDLVARRRWWSRTRWAKDWCRRIKWLNFMSNRWRVPRRAKCCVLGAACRFLNK